MQLNIYNYTVSLVCAVDLYSFLDYLPEAWGRMTKICFFYSFAVSYKMFNQC